MKVFIVDLKVKPECVDAFIDVTKRNAEGSVAEPGNVRFDLLRDVDDPFAFRLYEVWQDDAAIAAHREAAHYREWADAMKDMLSAPRTKTVSQPLFFK